MSNKITYYNDLADKHVFITGGASGIGGQLVSDFAAQGAKVSFIDKDQKSADKLCEEIESTGLIKPWFRKVDVTNVGKLKNSIVDAISDNGELYVLINNVANDTRHSPEELTEEKWRSLMAVNLDPTFFASQTAFPSLKKEGAGSIINVSSISALLAQPDMLAYVTAKSGIIGMTKSLARAYGPSNVRVNSILPGWVVTERQEELWRTPENIKEWEKLVALKDDILPSDISNLALFLASKDSRMITAQEFIIDAGRI